MNIVILLLALALPNLHQTPGVTRPLTRAQVCSVRWGRDRRHVTEAMKREVAKQYGISRASVKASGKGSCCEWDHLVPRELGGADNVRNLWPQPWTDAHQKDIAENRLHKAVCVGTVTLEAAQDEMRHWGRR